MLVKKCIHIITLTIVLACFCNAQNKSNSLIMLSNSKIEVGILPEVGGRIVLLRLPGYNNILKSNSNLWIDPDKHKPEISPFTNFVPFNGHITWVGPQNEWWIHQDLNHERKESKADWPPDPYLTYGKYNIVNKTDTSVRMIGPDSPISGVRFIKDVSICSNGIVTVTSSAQNIRKENVSWDLWMLTRVDGFANVYVPINKDGILRLKHNSSNTIEATPYNILDNFFTFTPSKPAKKKSEQLQEVHLYPTDGFIACFAQRQMLLISFDMLDRKLIHPNHGLVELYSSINKNADERLLELEIHGAYNTLAPGQVISLTQKWKVVSYSLSSDKKSQINFIKRSINSN